LSAGYAATTTERRRISGLEMGYVYQELLRRFSEHSGEEAGELFMPREVIRLPAHAQRFGA